MNAQFKTYEELMTHYWGVIVPLAEAAGIKPWECVRHVNDTYNRIYKSEQIRKKYIEDRSNQSAVQA